MSGKRRKSGPPIRDVWLYELRRWLLGRDDLPVTLPQAVTVACAWWSYASNDGRDVFPSKRTLENETHVDGTSIRAYRRYLECHGWLTDARTRRGRGGSLVFHLAVPEHGTGEYVLPTSEAAESRTGDGSGEGSGEYVLPGTPTSDQEEEGGGGSLGGAPAARASLLYAAVPPAWRNAVDWTKHDLRVELERLAAWDAGQLSAVFAGGWPEHVSKPTGLLLRRLRSLPADPSDHPASQPTAKPAQADQRPEAETSPDPSADLREWLNTLKQRPARVTVDDGPLRVEPTSVVEPSDQTYLDRFAHALTLSEQYPQWWAHVSGETDDPPPIEAFPWHPSGDIDPCATCGYEAPWGGDGGLYWCDRHAPEAIKGA